MRILKLTPFLLASGALALLPELAAAMTYTVTHDADTGVGSLRWAINQANDHPNNGADPFDTVVFDPAFFSSPRTITLLIDELAPSGPARIVGPGADLLTISGNDARRVFFVRSNSTIVISGMTIAHGLAVEGGASQGTGVQGGGINNQGTLTLNAVTVRDNLAEILTLSAYSRGGGINNGGRLTLNDCLITNNVSRAITEEAQSDFGAGGGIFNEGTLVASNSVISGNLAEGIRVNPGAASPGAKGWGGGVFSSGSATFDHCTLTGNTAHGLAMSPDIPALGFGGAIHAVGTLILRNGCVLSENTASATESGTNAIELHSAVAYGGAIYYLSGFAVPGSATILNSRIENNRAVVTNTPYGEAVGGAIHSSGIMTVRDSTLAGNSAETRAQGNASAKGGAVYSSGNLSVINCAVTGNGTFARNAMPIIAISQGGGIHAAGPMNLFNVTLGGNSCRADGPAVAVYGGGLHVNANTTVLRNATVAGNSCTTPSGYFAAWGGGIYGSADLGNTIVAANTVQTGGTGPGGAGPDTYGSMASQGHNLIGNPAGGNGFATNDLISVPPTNVFVDIDGSGTIDAGDLASSGVASGTFPLRLGSTARNAGNNALIPTDPETALPVETDQRGAGFSRVLGGMVDIGAYEGLLVTHSNLHVFEGFVDDDFLNVANWSSVGTPTPAHMAVGDTYLVLAPAVLRGAAVLRGTLQIDPAALAIVAVDGSLDLDTGCAVTDAGTLLIQGSLRTTGTDSMPVACSLVLNNTNASARVLEIAQGTELLNTGSVLFQAGEAMVRGIWQHNQAPLEVPAGAALLGDGLVAGGPVDVYGRIEPGPDAGYGDLNIQGDFTHRPEATTVIQVGGSGAGQFDRIVVSGLSAVGGTLRADFTARPLAAEGTCRFLVANGGMMFGYATRTPVGLAPTRSFAYDALGAPDRFSIGRTGTPYEDWAFASGLSLGVNDAPWTDANNDGVLNNLHFAFDTDPLGSGGGNEGKERAGFVNVNGTNHFSITLPVRKGAVFAGLPSPGATVHGITYTLLGSVNLQTWAEPVSEVVPANEAGLPALRDRDGDGTPDWEYRTFILNDPTPSIGFLRGVLQSPSGLVTWYRAESNHVDSFGPHHGTPEGMTGFGPGRRGAAFHFGTTNDAIHVGAASVPVPWTLALWVRRQDSPQSSAALCGSPLGAIKIEQYPNTRKVGFTQFGVADHTFNYSLPAGQWTHLALVGEPGRTTLYINGQRLESLPDVIPLPLQTLGRRDNGGDRFLGWLDEITVFNRALDEAEIQQVLTNAGGL